jgi:hypothetical protein
MWTLKLAAAPFVLFHFAFIIHALHHNTTHKLILYISYLQIHIAL